MPFELPNIPEAEQTPVVKGLLALVEHLIDQNQKLQQEVEVLKDEVRVLKGQKKRPKFKPSKLDASTDDEQCPDKEQGEQSSHSSGKRRRRNKQQLKIHRERVIKPDHVPEGSRFKGYQDFVVQELLIHSENIRYRLERWLSPDGQVITGPLPDALRNSHYGPTLRSYVLYQHHHCQVTQPLLLEQLREWGVQMSSGQLNRLLADRQDRFHAEKDSLLEVGLSSGGYVTVDDSSARHQGQNGFVTHIGNDAFAWFSSTPYKNRVNFLTLLLGGDGRYCLSADAFVYMRLNKLPRTPLNRLASSPIQAFPDTARWQAHLAQQGITNERHQRIATEGALMGAVLAQKGLAQLVIVSDGAGQFNVLQHAACWVHAERLIQTLVPLNESYRQAIETVRGQIWDFYRDLKRYKLAPDEQQAKVLSQRFDAIFRQETPYILLTQSLRRLHKKKADLLKVLERPEIPLHTNGSETAIRDYVKKRKVSGGTRSDLGRRCRDTFASLKKTCRKLGLSFWDYLTDRHGENQLPALAELVAQQLSGSKLATSL